MLVDNEEIFFVDYEADDSKTIIYAPLRSYLALISNESKKALLEEDNDVKAGILGRIKNRHLIDMKEILNEIRSDTPEISLPITDGCNLKCIYCHASAGDNHKKKSMSRDMIDAALEGYLAGLPTGTKCIKIHFFGGGEPTFKFDILKYAIEQIESRCQEKGLEWKYFMATNGCYGNDVRDFIIEKFKEVSLSFDGPAHIQNIHRPCANGNASFDTVFETAKYFYAKKFNFALRATVSSYSINYIEEFVDFVVEHFPNVVLGLEPLAPNGRALQHLNYCIDSVQFGDAMVNLYKYATNKPIKIVNAASSEYDTVRPVFCSGVGVPHWTININGDVVCCSRDQAPKAFTIGKFDEALKQIRIDEAKLDKIRDYNVYSFDECAECFAKYHCAGDCADRRLSGNLDCNSTRKMGQYILNAKIAGV